MQIMFLSYPTHKKYKKTKQKNNMAVYLFVVHLIILR
jgi:hypothetical protein